jgi:hypothetical protein
MNAKIAQLSQQMEFLNAHHLEDIRLFVEFLINKQQKEPKKQPKSKKRTPILADMQPIAMPVNDFILQRDDIYDDRIQYQRF